jgi:UBX domain-containing protein 1
MSNAITDEQLDSFISVTGASKERAKFYLEASNGDLDLAVGSFFEGGNDDDNPAVLPDSAASRPNAPMNLEMDDEEDEDDEDNDQDYRPKKATNPFSVLKKVEKNSGATREMPGRGTGNNRFATISSMNSGDNDEDQGGSDEDEKGQAFYAGGSRTSGQQIIGPPKKKNPEKIIKDLFQKAKEHGAEEVQSENIEASGSSRKAPVVYGNGYRLGTGNEPTEVIPGASRPKPPKTNILKLWKNGFNVDDGELRSYQDPKNKEFLGAIQRGEPPRELLRLADGAEVHLDMQDHREEEYEAPKSDPRAKPKLYNDGYKLGSPTPVIVSSATPSDCEQAESDAKQHLGLDASAASTQIQIRLSSGAKLVIKLNHTHTIADIRRYINRARPEYAQRVYALMTSFPNMELTKDAETVQEANILNAVIIQKLKE